MISKINPEDRAISGEVGLYDVCSDFWDYTAYYDSPEVLEKVRDEFFLRGQDIMRLYFRTEKNISHKKRKGLTQNLNKYVEENRVPVSFLFAYAQYKSGCYHTSRELKTQRKKITECDCFGILGELLSTSKYLIFRHWGKKVVLNDNESEA